MVFFLPHPAALGVSFGLILQKQVTHSLLSEAGIAHGPELPSVFHLHQPNTASLDCISRQESSGIDIKSQRIYLPHTNQLLG